MIKVCMHVPTTSIMNQENAYSKGCEVLFCADKFDAQSYVFFSFISEGVNCDISLVCTRCWQK